LIKQIALDLDGTLALENHKVSPATREALYALHHEEGVQVVIATGRRYRTTRYVIDNLGFDVYAVCNGGALVKSPDQETLHADDFHVSELALLARDIGLTIFAQRDAHHLGGADFLIDQSNNWNGSTRLHHANNQQWCETSDLTSGNERFLVCGCFGPEAELVLVEKAVHQHFPNRYNVILVPHLQTGYFYCEISQKHVDKWSGLCQIHPRYQMTHDQICTVGDQLNDMAMVQSCGHGIAMSDGHDDLKEVARFVCGPNDKDGIVDAVNYVRRINANQ